jgi:uncharacterized protein YfaP (DUF2135 family)
MNAQTQGTNDVIEMDAPLAGAHVGQGEMENQKAEIAHDS